MNNVFTDLQSIVEESSELATQYLGSHDKIYTEINKSIEEKSLQLMMFGAYNSGKSTLINAMLGSDSAPVQDIPTTFAVDKYIWNGFTILDTPGVNAPIEHENATEEQAKRTNVLLFIIREGDQDSKDLYQRMFKFLKNGKKIFIVVNHEASDPKHIATLIEKVNSILLDYASEHNISLLALEDISIAPVNLQTALTGAKKRSETLLDHSGFTAFVTMFKSWVLKQNTEKGILLALQNKINNIWFTPIIYKIDSKRSSNEGSLISQLNDALRSLKANKRSTAITVQNSIREKVKNKRTGIEELLLDSSSEQQFNLGIESLMSPVIKDIQSTLDNELSGVSKELEVILAKISSYSSDDKNSSSSICDLKIYDIAKKQVNKENITALLKYGRKLKINGLKGRWEKTLGKWAGKAAIVLQVAFFVFEVVSANDKQNKINEENRRIALKIKQSVDSISDSFIDMLMTSTQNIINENFESKITLIEGDVNTLNQQSVKLDKDYQKAITLRDNMMALLYV